ncbi:hypothetical protein EON63_08615 [archaeon]|nr:MAG: hypothetical protein EON63_08615 [archaeon]
MRTPYTTTLLHYFSYTYHIPYTHHTPTYHLRNHTSTTHHHHAHNITLLVPSTPHTSVILYVLIAGFLPFDEQTIVALFAKIQNAGTVHGIWTVCCMVCLHDAWCMECVVYCFMYFAHLTSLPSFPLLDFTYPSWFSPEVRALLDQMLVADPKTRITVSGILRNPWFVGAGGVGVVAGVQPTPLPTDAQVWILLMSYTIHYIPYTIHHTSGGERRSGHRG